MLCAAATARAAAAALQCDSRRGGGETNPAAINLKPISHRFPRFLAPGTYLAVCCRALMGARSTGNTGNTGNTAARMVVMPTCAAGRGEAWELCSYSLEKSREILASSDCALVELPANYWPTSICLGAICLSFVTYKTGRSYIGWGDWRECCVV